MPRRRSATLQFNAIQLVGGLLPASLLEQIARQEAPGQKAGDYGLQKNQRLQVAVDQAWIRARALWQEAQELRGRGEGMPWALWFNQRLLNEVFAWGDLAPCPPRQIEAALFPITHQAFSGAVPVVLTSLPSEELDKGHQPFGQEGRKRSPHSCLQDCLNADDGANWGLLGNGTSLRLLHDNPALVKPAFVQVEIGEILSDGLFDEFAVVWLLLHASRLQRSEAGPCLLDGWKEVGQQSGERALNKLRDGVQAALEAVGQGMLEHPANGELVARLQSGSLSTQEFFRQLLRLVYRLLFLCVAEDRDLLFPPAVPLELRQIYHQGYSLSRLRDGRCGPEVAVPTLRRPPVWPPGGNSRGLADPLAQPQLEAIADACRRHHVARLHTFGSVLRPDYRPGESDIDLLVEFQPLDASNLYRADFALLNDLRQALAVRVDWVMADALRNQYIRKAIEASKQEICAA